MSWKDSLLVTLEILRLLVNTITADDKYSLLNRGNLTQHIQMHLSRKQKDFSAIFFEFSKSTLYFGHSQTNMSLIAYVFPKLRTPKDAVR